MKLKPLTPLLALCAVLGAPAALAAPVSGITNDKGYGLHQLHLQSAGLLTVQFLSGLPDATLSIYNSAGQHLLTNDDRYGSNTPLDLDPVFSLNLAAGDYQLLVSYCCNSLGQLVGSGHTVQSSDGYHEGDYYLGGSSTLSSMMSGLDAIESPWTDVINKSYWIDVSGADATASHVPEPTSLLLAGGALALVGRRRRRQA